MSIRPEHIDKIKTLLEEQQRLLQDRIDSKQQRLHEQFEEKQRRVHERLELEQRRVQERIDLEQQRIHERLEIQQQRLFDRFGVSDISDRPGRERILEHARILFLERGFLDVSMREIAEAAGLRKATIYHHFRDKEDLFTAIALEEMAQLREQMTASIEGIASFPEQLEQLAFTQFEQMRGNSMRLAQDFRDHIPESRHEEMHTELEYLYEIYKTVFRHASERGELQTIEPEFAASSFFHIVLSWTWDFPNKIARADRDPRELAKTAVQILLYGVAGPALRREVTLGDA